MSSPSVMEATTVAIAEIRRTLAPFGIVEGAHGAFRAGHMPEIAPFCYSARVFNGLSKGELDRLESQLPFPNPEQTKAVIPAPLCELLSVTNGLDCHNLVIFGQHGRIDQGVGAPLSLSFSQKERPPGVSRLWFCFGAMSGPRASQGALYLTEKDEVVLVHRDTGEIGTRWPGLVDFLQTEIPRLLNIHDANGRIFPAASALPGNTSDWEEKAERANRLHGR